MRYYSPAFVKFTRIVRKNKGFNRYALPKILACYAKLFPSMLFAPVERWMYQGRIADTTLPQAPLYILGHWRSGTSFTQFLLNQDPRITTPTKFETLFPDNFFLTESLLKPLAISFIKKFHMYKAWKQNISVSMDLDSPSEIDTALINSASPYTHHWGHFFPKSWHYYFDRYALMKNLDKEEIKEWANSIKQLYRKIYLKKPNKRLLIKNPADTGRVQHLLHIYPHSQFIFVHRNPYQVYYSNVKFWRNITQMLSMQKISDREIHEIILSTYSKLHQSYLEQKALIPQGQLIEIAHHDLRAKPIQTLENVYDQLSLPDFDIARQKYQNYLADNLDKEKKNYDYDPSVIEEINDRWSFAFETWGYKKLVKEKVVA